MPAAKAALGIGVHGYFVAQGQFCRRGSCSWFGDFQLADGTVTRTDVILQGDQQPIAAGDTVPAIDAGSLSSVYAPTDRTAWVFPALLFALAETLFLGGPVIALLQRRKRRRNGGVDGGKPEHRTSPASSGADSG